MKPVRLLVLALSLGLSLTACGKGTNPTAPTLTAEQEVEAGNAALASGDYAAANQHFKAALAKDPTNPQANLGAAVTEVYLTQNDPDVAAIIHFVDSTASAPVAARPASARAGVRAARLLARLHLAPSGVANPIRGGRAAWTLLGRAVSDPPAISEVQRIVKTVVMPRLQYAEDRLAVLESDPQFSIKLPPSLTEEPDTLEVDLGEIYMLDAVVNGVQGWLGLLVAYNFDVPSYEHVNAESLLAPGTAWATLHPDGALQLAGARLNLLRVKTQIDQAVSYINAETDDQTDDLILATDLQSQGFLDFLDGVNQVAATLNGVITIQVDDYLGAPFAMQLHLERFFAAPIADLKTKFPNVAFDLQGDPYVTDPLTFPDPQIDLIFPDMTNERWQQLVGPVALAPHLAP